MTIIICGYPVYGNPWEFVFGLLNLVMDRYIISQNGCCTDGQSSSL